MNDEDFGLMMRHRELFEALAAGAPSTDWPRLWREAERGARAGAMGRQRFNLDDAYWTLATNDRTRWKVAPEILERMRER